MQVAASQFTLVGAGHSFALRRPLSKVGARKCAVCSLDVEAHSRDEVSDVDVLQILDVTADSRATPIVPGLCVGGFKAALATKDAYVLNCAGKRLHDFLPRTRAPFDALRAQHRVFDLEWEDDEAYVIDLAVLLEALRWVRSKSEEAGKSEESVVVVNCAQGKSRSGAAATAFLMAQLDLPVDEALQLVRQKRPFVQPNTGFMRQLRQHEAAIRSAFDMYKEDDDVKSAPPPPPS